MPTSLVTGGAGFIGSHLVDKLLERGDSVRVLDNLSTGNIMNLQGSLDRIDFIEGDIRNPEDLERVLDGIDLVFHQAAFVSVPLSLEEPDACLDTNVQGTRQVLELSRLAGVKRVVLASSAAVYGGSLDIPHKESGKIDLISPYAYSKYISEVLTRMYTRQLALDVVALRYFNIFGPRQNPDSDYAAVIPIFIKQFLAEESPVIHGDGKQSRDFVFVADVVQANLRAGDAPNVPGQVINICSGQETNLLVLLDTLSEIFNREIEPIFGNTRAGDIYTSVGDPSLQKELLDYSVQTSIRNGLIATAEWLKGSIVE
jgi:nucleoside-diphosphate-sugar epimerase